MSMQDASANRFRYWGCLFGLSPSFGTGVAFSVCPLLQGLSSTNGTCHELRSVPLSVPSSSRPSSSSSRSVLVLWFAGQNLLEQDDVHVAKALHCCLNTETVGSFVRRSRLLAVRRSSRHCEVHWKGTSCAFSVWRLVIERSFASIFRNGTKYSSSSLGLRGS